MSDTDTRVARLRRANRRWKALAVVACWALALAALAGWYAISRGQIETNRRLTEANLALDVVAGEPSSRPY